MGPTPHADVLIITAADGEDDAVRAVDAGAIGPWEEIPDLDDFGFTVWRRSFAARDGRLLRVALTKAVQMGTEASGHAAARLVDRLQPRCLAMCGVCAGRPKRTNLGDVLVAHERRFWLEPYEAKLQRDALGRQAFLDAASRAVAAVTLRGGAASKDIATELIDRCDGPKEQTFVNVLRHLYPGRSSVGGDPSYLAPLEPDLMGEHLVLAVLTGPETPSRYLLDVFADNDLPSLTTGFTVLGRISTRREADAKRWVACVLDANVNERALPALFGALALTTESAFAVVGPVLEAALDRESPISLAPTVERFLPEQTVSLRGVAVWALRALLTRSLADSDDERAERARLLNNLGNRLSELGQTEEGLEATKEAVALYCDVAEGRPGLVRAISSHLATSLRNLIGNLAGLNRAPEEEPLVLRALALLEAAGLVSDGSGEESNS